ncbi:MAG: TonB-dependent receptor [Aliiglaciecola sp.]
MQGIRQVQTQPFRLWTSTSTIFSICLVTGVHAAVDIERLTVSTSRANLVGAAISASQGVVSEQEFQFRPLLRNGELLELIPGMIATQHSGSGKANQLFLRGFNLDHGTDFATIFDGMPVNIRSHGHGQGYTDLNFIIAETVGQIDFKKGPYYADVGDFSGAGSAAFISHEKLKQNFAAVTVGQHNYLRSVAATQLDLQQNTSLCAAAELQTYDGPWTDINEDVQKKNVFVKARHKTSSGSWALSFMAYDNQWNGADQIPQRAVEQGLLDRLGSLDTTTGGNSSRYSANLQWNSEKISFNAFAIDYQLQLYSNFTYILDNPESSDQFEQLDNRLVYGFNFHRHFEHHNARTTFGISGQYDDIMDVGLFATHNRQRQGAIRLDKVEQQNLSAYVDHRFTLSDRLYGHIGGRYDYFQSDVHSQLTRNINGVELADNSGSKHDGLSSLKAGLVFEVNEQADVYLSAGQGFHSNDARGTVSTVDPIDGSAIRPVDPLVRSQGSEIGLRWSNNDTFNASVALWQLSLDSELLFVGDAGNTEPSLASRRSGIEMTAYWRISDLITFDAEYAQSNARFTGVSKENSRVPGAIDRVAQLGVSAHWDSGLTGSLRIRHFGPRVLEESGQVRSQPSTTLNALAAYRWRDLEVKVEILNLLNSKDHDIDYFYSSRLATEPESGVEDVHFHPLAPRNVRLSLRYTF